MLYTLRYKLYLIDTICCKHGFPHFQFSRLIIHNTSKVQLPIKQHMRELPQVKVFRLTTGQVYTVWFHLSAISATPTPSLQMI